MKRHDLLKCFDDDLLDKLFGFSYARTKDSYEAEELCSDIIYALVRAAYREGEIESVYSFIWKVAHNVYADFASKRRKRAEMFYEGDSEEIIRSMSQEETLDNAAEQLTSVYRRIAYLTKAYREVMIMFYIDGLSTAQIAKEQGINEGTVRQRLFSARRKLKKEVEQMSEATQRPVALDKINFVIWGTGNPSWGDPRSVCTRMFSKHIIWLCHTKAMSASEIAEALNVPTVYVEEELDIICRGGNGEYGFLRLMDNGKYALNFVLLDKDVFEKANALYTEQLPKICDIISKYIEDHKTEYLAFPYLNRHVDMNLILWQQVFNIADAFTYCVRRAMARNHFSNVAEPKRPFSIFGYVDNGKDYGAGWDGVDAQNVCGFASVHLDNIYVNRIKKHFHCGLNVSNDPQIQLALQAIDGLDIACLSEREKEQAAKAIECGYLLREGNMLYTKILVNTLSDCSRLFDISNALQNGYFDDDAEIVANKLAALIKKAVPDHLLGEWRFANQLANLPIYDAVIECLIDKGMLTPPEDGIGAEGCWMSVEK